MHWSPLSWWLELLRFGKSAIYTDEAEPEDRPAQLEDARPIGELQDEALELEDDLTPPLSPPPKPLLPLSVGAWCGTASLASSSAMARDVAFAKALGLRRLDIVVNDHSAKRAEIPFGTYKRQPIIDLAKRANDAGLAVHLMTWCMPHEAYLEGLVQVMVKLANDCDAVSVMLDAEEPWVNAKRPIAWDAAAAIVGDGFGQAELPWGVTGIGYASTKKLGPLVRRAEYMVPQCYSTAGNTLNPKTASTSLSARWRRNFGDRQLVVGLAGYRQEGRPGYTKEEFMTAAFDCAQRASAAAIVYWSLRQIRSSRTTANIIAKLTASVRAEAA